MKLIERSTLRQRKAEEVEGAVKIEDTFDYEDKYAKRPLPYIFGTNEFLKDDFCGLKIEEQEEEESEEEVEEEEEETEETPAMQAADKENNKSDEDEPFGADPQKTENAISPDDTSSSILPPITNGESTEQDDEPQDIKSKLERSLGGNTKKKQRASVAVDNPAVTNTDNKPEELFPEENGQEKEETLDDKKKKRMSMSTSIFDDENKNETSNAAKKEKKKRKKKSLMMTNLQKKNQRFSRIRKRKKLQARKLKNLKKQVL